MFSYNHVKSKGIPDAFSPDRQEFIAAVSYKMLYCVHITFSHGERDVATQEQKLLPQNHVPVGDCVCLSAQQTTSVKQTSRYSV